MMRRIGSFDAPLLFGQKNPPAALERFRLERCETHAEAFKWKPQVI
jgi:hypothetical protein